MSESTLTFLARPEIWVSGLALAAFLALYWALRGAPLGQSANEEADREAPGAGYRDRIVAAAVGAMLLVAAGAYVAIKLGILWSLVPFALGYGSLIALVRANHRYRHASPILRRVLQFTDLALNGSLVAGILIVGNVLAFKYGERPLDLTSERAFTLESLTVRQLKDLDKPVRFIVVYGNREISRRQLHRIGQLLELYKAENPRLVRHDRMGAYEDPMRFEELVRTVPDVAIAERQGGGVVVEYGEGEGARRLVVRNSEMFEHDASQQSAEPGRFGSNFRGEDALTSALIRLREGKGARVVFLTGHGEPSIHETAANKPGLGLLANRLAAIGCQVGVHNLTREALAGGTDVVIIVEPKTAFEAREASRLRDYVQTGGHVLILDNGLHETGLADWLATFNLSFGPQVVVDPTYNFANRPNIVAAQVVGDVDHPIIESLRNMAVLVYGASPLMVQGGGRPGESSPRAPNPEYVARPVLRTSPSAWGEAEPKAVPLELDPKKDLRGPLTVGAAVTTAGSGAGAGRPVLVVFSSPYVGQNYFVERDQANLDILVNAVSWLRGRPDLQGLTPRRHVALTLSANPVLRTRLILLPTVVAMTLIVAAGIFTFYARRA
jgi:hypothetical protein